MIVVVREDLTPAYQAVQCGHSVANFCLEHNDIANSWHKNSQYLAYLSVKDEDALLFLIEKAHSKGITISVFKEPDLDNQVTAIALEPSEESRKLCKNLPCALKDVESTGLIDKNTYKKSLCYETA